MLNLSCQLQLLHFVYTVSQETHPVDNTNYEHLHFDLVEGKIASMIMLDLVKLDNEWSLRIKDLAVDVCMEPEETTTTSVPTGKQKHPQYFLTVLFNIPQ